jgi:hypothetical protein
MHTFICCSAVLAVFAVLAVLGSGRARDQNAGAGRRMITQ